MTDLPEPKENAIFLEDKKVYGCLANEPKVKGHSVLVWKNHVKDLTLLDEEDYIHLMRKLEKIQKALEEVYQTEKVYLIYMDETKHVHWHLIPRKNNKKGPELLNLDSGELKDTKDARKIEETIESL